jgi:hypothetical protein
VELVGLSTPGGSGVPLAELAAEGDLLRFADPPCVLLRSGELLVSSGRFNLGWVSHVRD